MVFKLFSTLDYQAWFHDLFYLAIVFKFSNVFNEWNCWFFIGWCYYFTYFSKPTTPLIDEIDFNNWVIDDIEEPKEFQTNPPSFDVKQTCILEKKQDSNVIFKSFLIEDDIMEIPLCCMIFMQVVRSTLTSFEGTST